MRGAVGIATVFCTLGIAHCASGSKIPVARFWFDNITFELPQREIERLGGPLRNDEISRIRSIALAELRAAYSGIPLTFTDDAGAPYQVAVLQALKDARNADRRTSADAGQSRTLGPFGGRGAVSFLTLATHAIHYAPPGATRAQIVEGIGRGIARSAAHEFAHQILPDVDLHATRDKESYEYGNADRAAQYYGELHWTSAHRTIAERLGGRWWSLPVGAG
jgi:hypothetical protein